MTEEKKPTALQELIQWTIENAFNIEGQDGVKYIAIDHEEMRKHFDTWLEKEKEQIIDAFEARRTDDSGYEIYGENYYNQTFKS